MKSVIFRTPGGPDVLEMADLPDPIPGPGEVLIRTKAMAVSVPDLLIRQGVYKWMPPLPASPGNELTGVIETLGDGVSEFAVGQPVLLSAREMPVRGGCYAELKVAPATAVHALADGCDFAQAAVLPSYVVAHAMLNGLGLSANAKSIFVTGAAGSIATALADLATAQGITVIGSVSSDTKAGYARAHGFDHTINYKTETLLERVKALTDGRGVDAAFDHVIGPVFTDCVRMLGDFGTAVAYNVFSPMPEEDIFGELRDLCNQSPAIRVFNIHTLDHDRSVLRRMMRELVDMLDAGSITPSVGATLPMAEAAEAHKLLDGGEVLGKIILTP